MRVRVKRITNPLYDNIPSYLWFSLMKVGGILKVFNDKYPLYDEGMCRSRVWNKPAGVI